MKQVITTTIFLAFGLNQMVQPSPAQTQDTPTQNTQIQSIPPSVDPVVLYGLFLRNTAWLSRKADELDRSNGGGAGLRKSFASKVGLADPDAERFLKTAVALDAQLGAIDLKARLAIAETKKKRVPGGLVPPPPAVLNELQSEANKLVTSAVAALPAALGTRAAANIDRYIRTSGASAVSSTVGGRQ